MRRASFLRLGDDRLARAVPGRGSRAHQAHQAWHRRRFAALPSPLQRRAAHRAARSHDLRTRDFRYRPRRLAFRRADFRHRLHAPARPPGRSHRRPETTLRRRARHLQGRMVPAQRRATPDPAVSGRSADGGRVLDQPIRHAARRKVRHGRPVHRVRPRRKACRHCRPSGRSPRRRRRSTIKRSTGGIGVW